MKWNHNGITYRRGCYETLIAQYDGKGVWFVNRGLMTQQTMKSTIDGIKKHTGGSQTVCVLSGSMSGVIPSVFSLALIA